MKDRIRICFISYKFSPAIGGAEMRAEKQARQLQAFGHEVMVITLRINRSWKRSELLNGLPVVRVGGIYRRNGLLRLGKLGQLAIEITILLALWRRRHHYDIIHAFQLTPPSAVAVLFCHIIKKPIVLSMQNAGPDEHQLASLLKLEDGTLVSEYGLRVDWKEDWALAGGDLMGLPQHMLGSQFFLYLLRKSRTLYQVLSTRSYSYLIEQGFHPEQIIRISGSVDTEKFRPAQDRIPDLTVVERKIICVSRLEYAKGIDILLHAWAQMMHLLSEQQNELKPMLLLVGEGKFRKQLERMMIDLGIQDSVKFLGLRTDIISLLQQSWGFVLASRWEGMSNALLEAMACGLPCVATRVSGSEDIISDGINGLLVEPEQPVEMAHALRRLIEDADFAQRLGREGRKTIVRDYQLTDIVERCLELYRNLLKGEKLEDRHRIATR